MGNKKRCGLPENKPVKNIVRIVCIYNPQRYSATMRYFYVGGDSEVTLTNRYSAEKMLSDLVKSGNYTKIEKRVGGWVTTTLLKK